MQLQNFCKSSWSLWQLLKKICMFLKTKSVTLLYRNTMYFCKEESNHGFSKSESELLLCQSPCEAGTETIKFQVYIVRSELRWRQKNPERHPCLTQLPTGSYRCTLSSVLSKAVRNSFSVRSVQRKEMSLGFIVAKSDL